MIYEEHFAHVKRQLLWHKQTLLTPSGLRIRSNGTSWASIHEAFKGEDGTELVIGEQSEVEISFSQEVESLRLECYVPAQLLLADAFRQRIYRIHAWAFLHPTLLSAPPRAFSAPDHLHLQSRHRAYPQARMDPHLSPLTHSGCPTPRHCLGLRGQTCRNARRSADGPQ